MTLTPLSSRRLIAAVAMGVALFTASCAGSTSAPGSSPSTGGTSGAAASAATVQPPPSNTDGYAPGAARDAQWTLLCNAIAGEGHVERARRIKAELAKATGLPNWYLVHKDNETELYYGYYEDISSRTPAGKRAQADRRKIASMADADGSRPFARATFVTLPSPDPTAPAEWNLANARGAWSLQIAAYSGHPQRKQYAVDAVREARKSGIEAYYYHGDSVSSVCIGAWPEEAVAFHDMATVSHDPDQSIFIVPPGEEVPQEPVYDRNGRPMLVVKPRMEIIDPSLRALMNSEDYKYHATNGELIMVKARDRSTGQIIDVPRDRSFLVRIPDEAPAAPSLLDDSTTRDGTDRPDLLAPPDEPARPGTGRLRSIGG